MQFSPAQLGMEVMLRGSHPILPDAFPETTKSEWITWGRIKLIQCTGQDFGYNLEAWHQHLLKTDDGNYKWAENHLRFPEAIEATVKNDSWLKAVTVAESQGLFEKISEEVRVKREAEEVAENTWGGKFRNCPICQTSFKSIKDRGQCPKCGLLFRASQAV